MKQSKLYQFSVKHLVPVFTFFVLAIHSMTLYAEIITVDPAQEPTVTLSPEEAQKLKTLLSASFVIGMSVVSPDDRAILVLIPQKGELFFQHLDSDRKTAVASEIFTYQWLTDFRWKDNCTLETVGQDSQGMMFKLSINRRDGSITKSPLDPAGVVIDLSTRGRKLLVARPVQEALVEKYRSGKRADESIIRKQPLRRGYEFADSVKSVPVAVVDVKIVIIDLETNEEKELLQIPSDIAIIDVAWSNNDRKLAIVRGKIYTWPRGGVTTVDDDEVQDVLGNIPPEDNPFFNTNALEIFTFGYHRDRHVRIPADLYDGEIFFSSVWSPNEQILMVQTMEPSIIKGREYPLYSNNSGTNYKFFFSNGWMFHKLQRPEVDALYGSMAFISSYEVLIDVFDRLSSSVYYYNIFTRQMKRLPTPEGYVSAIYPYNFRREIVYEFNSLQQPYELFNMNLCHGQIKPVTNANNDVRQANRIRVDKVYFTLSNGVQRTGYLIQPRDAEFPPRNVPICVWQNGGPTAPMINQWSGFIESSHNILPNFGIATLMVPLPGRIGFGKEFLNGLVDYFNFGQIDIDEQMEISQQLIDRGYTSHEKIGIYGMSYGGYFTAQTITTYPDFYAAANNQFSLINLFHEFEFGYMGYITYLMGCTPDNYDEYFRDSPLQRAANVEIPTLVYTSSNDFLPAEFSIQFHDEINATGNTHSQLYYFLHDGHGLNYPNNQFVAGQAQIEWFRHYLAD